MLNFVHDYKVTSSFSDDDELGKTLSSYTWVNKLHQLLS
jgi:hypothetical protein